MYIYIYIYIYVLVFNKCYCLLSCLREQFIYNYFCISVDVFFEQEIHMLCFTINFKNIYITVNVAKPP